MNDGKSVDQIMFEDMEKHRSAANKSEKELRNARYGMGEMLGLLVKELPAQMVRQVCEHHGYTLLDNGLYWSKHNDRS